ncbi:MAG: hypothetical protein FJ146_12205 [Deltaproteobacteria bacterium]|nr:hypothetical protein [Deltaproteobacteria bacterium]
MSRTVANRLFRNRSFILVCLCPVALSVGAYWRLSDESSNNRQEVYEAPNHAVTAAPEVTASEQGADQTNLNAEIQHLQIMEMELAHAKAAVSRGKRRLAELEKSGRAGADSLDAKTTRDKLEADRKLVERLKSALKVQESAVATLRGRTAGATTTAR